MLGVVVEACAQPFGMFWIYMFLSKMGVRELNVGKVKQSFPLIDSPILQVAQAYTLS